MVTHAGLRSRNLEAELVVCGTPDPGNPSSIPDDVIAQWAARPGVRFLGQVADVRAIMAECRHWSFTPRLAAKDCRVCCRRAPLADAR